jgi:hypothetical protein
MKKKYVINLIKARGFYGGFVWMFLDYVCITSRSFSIVVIFRGGGGVSSPFKFENMWLKCGGFVERVQQ